MVEQLYEIVSMRSSRITATRVDLANLATATARCRNINLNLDGG